MQDSRRDVLTFGSEGYAPHGSGVLQGGGAKRHPRNRRTRHRANLPFIRLSDSSRIKELPDFDSKLSYTGYDLAMLAEKMLMEDEKPATEHPAYLSAEKVLRRQRHEIYVADGVPDPAYVSGLYWRVHPNGVRFVADPDDRRLTGASFYKH